MKQFYLGACISQLLLTTGPPAGGGAQCSSNDKVLRGGILSERYGERDTHLVNYFSQHPNGVGTISFSQC